MRTLVLLFIFSFSAAANDFKFKGDQAWTDGFHSLAWEYYSKAVGKTPAKEIPSLLHRLSTASIKAGKVQESLKILKGFLNGAAAKESDTTTLSQLYQSKAVLELELHLWGEASRSCSFILKNSSKIPQELLRKTLETAVFALTSDRKLEDASKLLEKYEKSFRDSTAAQLQNARLKILLGQYVNAIAILNKHLEGKETLPHFLALWAYQKAGNNAKAVEIYKSNLEQAPAVNEPLYTDILIQLGKGAYTKQPKESVEILNRAYSLEKDKVKKGFIVLKKSELYISSGNSEEAVKELQYFLKNHPESEKIPAVNYQLGALYSGEGSKPEDLLKAEAYVTAAVDKSEKELQYSALVMRGNIRRKLKKMTEAAEDMKSASSVAVSLKSAAEKAASPLFTAGSIEYSAGLETGSKEAFMKAAGLFGMIPSLKSALEEKALLMQGQSYRKAGEYSRAVEVFRKMTGKFPKNLDVLFLGGISLIEAGEYLKGVRKLRKFTTAASEDPRTPTAFIEAYKAAIYGLEGKESRTEALRILSQFKGMYEKKRENVNFAQAAPVIHHLEALMNWKHQMPGKAAEIWEEFLKVYPEHYLSVEVRLWIAFHLSRLKNPDLEEAAEQYEHILSLSDESSLSGFTMLQAARNLYRRDEYIQALELLEKSEDFYRKAGPKGENADRLASVLFFTGEVYTRLGEFGKALKSFSDALTLSGSPAVKRALKGRIGDCHFSQAGQLKGAEDKQPFINSINSAAKMYESVYKDLKGTKRIKEQALYKLAKCSEEIGLLGEKEQSNSHLDNARNNLFKLFFDFQDDIKKGIKRDPYYFCRAGYDLARLQLTFKDPNIRSALSTYRILAESGFPGTAEAKILADELEKVLKKADK